jgi:8-oxo-dGTP diphosphatase
VPFTYPYARPAVTADVVVFDLGSGALRVLLIERKHAPFEGAWALPGGFVDENEPLDAAALRELREETGLTGVHLVQVGAFGDPGRDPRGHTVSVAYVTRVDAEEVTVTAGDDAARAEWVAWTDLALGGPRTGTVQLAFDHDRILLAARSRAEALPDGLLAPT